MRPNEVCKMCDCLINLKSATLNKDSGQNELVLRSINQQVYYEYMIWCMPTAHVGQHTYYTTARSVVKETK